MLCFCPSHTYFTGCYSCCIAPVFLELPSAPPYDVCTCWMEVFVGWFLLLSCVHSCRLNSYYGFFCCIAPAGTAGFIILLFSLDRWIAHMLNNIITVVCIVCLLLCSLAVLRLNFVKYLYHWKRKAYY